MRKFSALKRVNGNMKFIMIGLLILAVSGTIFSQKVWTLKDCIEYALDNNIQIKKSEISAEINKTTLLQSKLDLVPSFNGSSSFTFGSGRTDNGEFEYVNTNTKNASFSLQSGVTLFNGFQKYNTIKQNQFNYLASKYDSDKMRDDISLMLAQNYLNVLFSTELVEKSQAQLEVTEQQIRNTQKLVDAGTLPKGNLLEIQSQFASEEVALINAENRLNLAYLDLLQLLELPATDDFVIEKPMLSVSKEMKIIPSEQIYGISVTHLPQIKSAELRYESASKGVAIARGSRSPSISAYAGWRTNYYDQIHIYDQTTSPWTDLGIKPFKDQYKDNQNKYLQFSLNIPIFNGYATSSNITRAKLSQKTAEYDLQLSKNTVRKSIEQAFSDALAAYKTYNASLKSVASFQEAFKYMEQKFNVGIENSLNYNIAKMQLTKAESDLLASKYDYIFKSKILDFYMGNPITLMEN